MFPHQRFNVSENLQIAVSKICAFQSEGRSGCGNRLLCSLIAFAMFRCTDFVSTLVDAPTLKSGVICCKDAFLFPRYYAADPPLCLSIINCSFLATFSQIDASFTIFHIYVAALLRMNSKTSF